MSHEQSETVQAPDGSWVNVYGRATPLAGQQLPGTPAYPSLEAAVTAARSRSAGFGESGLAGLLHRAYGVAMTPLPAPPQLTDEQLARLKASAQSAVGGLAGLLPSLPEGALPMMPEWLRRYSEERGLLPGQESVPPGAQR